MEVKINSEFVRELRGKENWSQEDLAAASGLSLRTIQRVENQSKAGLETRRALAAAFGIKPDDLNFDGSAHQPGEAALGGGLLLAWIAVAWYFELGIAVGLIGVGATLVIGQVGRVTVGKLPVLWDLAITGLVCLLAGIGALGGLDVRLGPIILLALGCGLIVKAIRA